MLADGLAMLIFRDANKHGSRHPTAWGLFTSLAALRAIPLSFLNYWLGKRPDQPRRRRPCPLR